MDRGGARRARPLRRRLTGSITRHNRPGSVAKGRVRLNARLSVRNHDRLGGPKQEIPFSPAVGLSRLREFAAADDGMALHASQYAWVGAYQISAVGLSGGRSYCDASSIRVRSGSQVKTGRRSELRFSGDEG
jgi:hypothetical protein